MATRKKWISTLLLVTALTAQQPHARPVSDRFALLAEAAIDKADRVDVLQSRRRFEEDAKPFQADLDALGRAAKTQTERDVVAAISLMDLTMTTCQMDGEIQSKHFDECLSNLATARTRAMTLMGRHKALGVWSIGPPNT